MPGVALYLEVPREDPLGFGFFLRSFGLGLGMNQALRGLGGPAKAKPITKRIVAFVNDPAGLPDPGRLDGWEPDPPARRGAAPNWMLAAKGLITFGNLPKDKPHILAGTLIAALDQELRLTLGINLWLFTSPNETTQTDFLASPAARGAMQISPREQKAFGFFRTLPNPKLGKDCPALLAQVLNNVQTTLAFLADRNGFLVEVGWPWQTRARLPLPSPLKGELTAGFRFGVYRGVTCFALNYAIDIALDAEAGIDFKTPLGTAGAKFVVKGSGYFRASFVGAIDEAFRPQLLGDVRVGATVRVGVEAHADFSKKITRWLKIKLRIRIKASFNLSITAALTAAMDRDGLGFVGDAQVSVSVSGYRIAGTVPFELGRDRVEAVRARLAEIMPPPILGN